jgi:hypothetical protein
VIAELLEVGPLSKRAIAILVAVLLGIVGMTVLLSTHEVTEIDLGSGKVRQRQYLWGLCVRTRRSDTEFSRLCDRLGIKARPEDWHRVYRFFFFPPIRVSTHYRYHNAIGICEDFTKILSYSSLTEQEKREEVSFFLDLLRRDGRDASAHEYIRRAIRAQCDRSKEKRSLWGQTLTSD